MKTIDLQPVARPDVTIIPNSIIDLYMPEANELQLKVYLYILRNIGTGNPIRISHLVDYFNETEKDITRAVAFWEKRGVFASHNEGKAGAAWVLCDFDTSIVHIFDRASRDYYRLERLLPEDKKIDLQLNDEN